MANSFGFGIGASIGFGVGTPLQYPLVNGFAYSWASIEFKFAGSAILTVQSIDYKVTNEAKWLYGTNPNPLGQTRGKITNTAKVKMLLAEMNALLNALAAQDPTGNSAYGDVFFDVTITYSETGNNVICDELRGCRITTVEQSSAEGPDGIMLEAELNPTQILRDGLPMSSAPLAAPQFP